MSYTRNLDRELKDLLSGVKDKTVDKQEFISTLRLIAKSYGLGYGYCLRRIGELH